MLALQNAVIQTWSVQCVVSTITQAIKPYIARIPMPMKSGRLHNRRGAIQISRVSPPEEASRPKEPRPCAVLNLLRFQGHNGSAVGPSLSKCPRLPPQGGPLLAVRPGSGPGSPDTACAKRDKRFLSGLFGRQNACGTQFGRPSYGRANLARAGVMHSPRHPSWQDPDACPVLCCLDCVPACRYRGADHCRSVRC